MRQIIAEMWADALESGEYPQGAYALHENGTYCGIGVLAHLAWQAGIIERSAYETHYNSGFAYDGDKFALTPKAMEWAGFQHGTDIQIPRLNKSVMGLNDMDGMSFAYIADVIRENWQDM